MGISGLLQGIKSLAKDESRQSIRDFAHQSLAIDTSSWLHKSVYSIADHYVEVTERGELDAKCISVASNYVIRRCNELLEFAHIKRIFLVMDGERCPLKSVTNQERERRRQENLQQARVLRQKGQSSQSFDKYKACIKVRADLGKAVAAAVVEKFGASSRRVQIVWSPYEADAQLVKLVVDGFAQAIVTEDSDVLVYAATCQSRVPVLLKLDRHSGKCDVFSMEWLMMTTDSENRVANRNVVKKSNKRSSGLDSFLQVFGDREGRKRGVGVRLFVQSCVLAGSDYTPSQLDGVGTVTAFKYVRNSIHRSADARFSYIIKTLPTKIKWAMEGSSLNDYRALLCKAEAVFYYHPVRDLCSGKVVYLNHPDTTPEAVSLEQFDDDLTFLGRIDSSETATMSMKNEKRKADADHPSLPPSKRSLETFLYSKAPLNKAIVNPYKSQSTTQPKPDDQQPLGGQHPSIGRTNSRRENNDDKKLPPKDSEIDEKRARFIEKYRSGTDVRFVKRTFPRDGTSAPPPKIAVKPFSRDNVPVTKTSIDKNEVLHPVKDQCLSSDEETEISDEEVDRLAPHCDEQVGHPKTSKFFNGSSRGYVRRITMDSDLDPTENLPDPPTQAGVIDLSAEDRKRRPTVPSRDTNTFDDFLSPTKKVWLLEDEDILESPPNHDFLVVAPAARDAPPAKSSPWLTTKRRSNSARFRLGGNVKQKDARPRKMKILPGQTSLLSHFRRNPDS